MSNGFRLLLLILLGFGAVWIYRFRARELNLLLSPARRVLANPDGTAPLVGDRAFGRLKPPVRSGWERLGSTDWEGMSAWSPERLEPGETPWRETQKPPEPHVYEAVEHDPDLVYGAFEEAADGLIQSAYATHDTEDTPRPETGPETEDVESEGDLESTPSRNPMEPGDPADPSTHVPGTIIVDYVVREHDNLWKIAERFLGKGHRHPEIARLNGLTSETLVVGTRLKVRVPETRVQKENLKSGPEVDDKSVEASSGLRENSLTHTTHRVKARETLSQIASKYFPGDPGGLQVLFEANKETLSSPDEILEGQILVIPPRRSS